MFAAQGEKNDFWTHFCLIDNFCKNKNYFSWSILIFKFNTQTVKVT